MIHELATPLPVEITAADLPRGVRATVGKGICIAWWVDGEAHDWLVVLDQTGECVWVPMKEVKLRESWSNGRRYSREEKAA